MATITDHNGEELDVLVVLVDGGDHRVIGLAHIADFMTSPAGHVQVIEPVKEGPVSHRPELTFDPDTIEALRKVLVPKQPEPDIEELIMQVARVQYSTKRDDRFDKTDRIPVPKRYQRNRFKR